MKLSIFLLSTLTAIILFLYVNINYNTHTSIWTEIRLTWTKTETKQLQASISSIVEKISIWTTQQKQEVWITITTVKQNKEITLTPIKQESTQTCVPDNLKMVLKFTYNQDLNVRKLYTVLHKPYNEFWHIWLYAVNDEYGWEYTPVREWEYYIKKSDGTYISSTKLTDKDKTSNKYIPVWEYRDFEKLNELGIYTEIIWNVDYMKDIINDWHPVIMSVPISLLDNSNIASTIHHAITIYKYDEQYLYYVDTRDGSYKKILLDKVLYNKTRLLYPFIYVTHIEYEKSKEVFES